MPSLTRRQMSPRESAAVDEVQALRRHARLLQGGDLVGHQGNQRRDDEAETGPDQRRDLVAQALAAAGRQHGQRAAPGQHFADHAGLQATELGMAESAAQDVARGVERRGLAGIGSAELGIGIHGCVMQRALAEPQTGAACFQPFGARTRHRKGYLTLRSSTDARKVDSEWMNARMSHTIMVRFVLTLALIAAVTPQASAHDLWDTAFGWLGDKCAGATPATARPTATPSRRTSMSTITGPARRGPATAGLTCPWDDIAQGRRSTRSRLRPRRPAIATMTTTTMPCRRSLDHAGIGR